MKRTATAIALERRFTGETLRTTDPTRAEQLAIVSTVTSVLPDREDYLPVLQALLAPGRPALPPHGTQHSLTYQAARTEWLDLVRAWVLEQGRVLHSRHVCDDDQRAYVAATGNHFQAPEEDS